MDLYYLVPAAGLLALLYALYLSNNISKADAGNSRMKEIASAIHEGAMAFLTREYKVLVFFIIGMVALILILGFTTGSESLKPETAIAYIMGTITSILAGYFGMNVATKANVRTANAAQSGMNKAFGIAFSGGAVMGMCVVGLGM